MSARAPWDFSFTGDPKAKLVPNKPTALGEAAGKELARLVAPWIAKDRERCPNTLPPCHDCAFVAGTEPNRSPSTVMDALKCMIEGEPFYCHKGLAPNPETGLIECEPKRLCAGWLASQSGRAP